MGEHTPEWIQLVLKGLPITQSKEAIFEDVARPSDELIEKLLEPPKMIITESTAQHLDGMFRRCITTIGDNTARVVKPNIRKKKHYKPKFTL